MIPKIIHYCWFSDDPYPDKIQNCIESWKKHLPDYKIKRWSYENFPPGKSKWVDEAVNAKKYAFAADYIRCYALYTEGGIYLDSDVEVLKSFDPLLKFPYFIGEENDGAWEAAVMGSVKGNLLFGQMINYYDSHDFLTPQGGYNVEPMPFILRRIGNEIGDVRYINSIDDFTQDSNILQILPFDYFSPKSYKTGEFKLTDRTFSIHHFTASWHGKKEFLYETIAKFFGKRFAKRCSEFWKAVKK